MRCVEFRRGILQSAIQPLPLGKNIKYSGPNQQDEGTSGVPSSHSGVKMAEGPDRWDDDNRRIQKNRNKASAGNSSEK